jgi:flagellar biosynthesis protein FlhF
MQVKKFEAPTIQEALDTIKRELGPDAIILQTKKHKRGFGLMSKSSIEVTAAVSERSLHKKQYVEKRMPESAREAIKKLPADKQAEFYAKSTPSSARRPGTGGALVAGAYRSSAASGSNSVPQRPAPFRGAPVDQLISSSDAYTPSSSSGSSVAQRARPPAPPRNPGSLASPVAGPSQAQLYAQAQIAAQAQARAQAFAESVPAPKVTSRRYVEIDDLDPAGQSLQPEMQEELKHLKRMIEELKSAQDFSASATGSAHSLGSMQGSISTPALQSAFEQLVVNGLEKRYALALIKTVSFELGAERAENPDEVMEQLATEIMKNTQVVSPLAAALRKIAPGSDADRRSGPVILALVGPTGVGKTTTVAKLASEAILKHNAKVGLINLDSYKIAAFDQLGTYAKILNVPFRSVATADELRDAVRDFQSLDLVLVDTTGRSQRDPESLREMQALVATIPGVCSQLVLSVTTRDAELYDMANRFSIFGPQGLIVSKLDESTSHGAIYNIAMRTKLPLLCFTTGQRVPEDIEDATRERVAALLLDI